MKREQRKAYSAIMKALTPIVDKTVKHYRTDFDGENDYCDKVRLATFCADPDKEKRFVVWGVRDSGTDIGYKKDLTSENSWIRACADFGYYEKRQKWFEIDVLTGLVKPIKDIQKYIHLLALEKGAA